MDIDWNEVLSEYEDTGEDVVKTEMERLELPGMWPALIDAAREKFGNVPKDVLKENLYASSNSAKALLPTFEDIAVAVFLTNRADEFIKMMHADKDRTQDEISGQIQLMMLEMISMLWAAGYCQGAVEEKKGEAQVDVKLQGNDQIMLGFSAGRLKVLFGEEEFEKLFKVSDGPDDSVISGEEEVGD